MDVRSAKVRAVRSWLMLVFLSGVECVARGAFKDFGDRGGNSWVWVC